MSRGVGAVNKDIKTIERLLRAYPYAENRIKAIEIKIKMLKNDLRYALARDNDQDKGIIQMDRIEILQGRIRIEEFNKVKIEEMLGTLSKHEEELVKERYFKDRRIADLSYEYGCSQAYIYKKCRSIITRKMDGMILLIQHD